MAKARGPAEQTAINRIISICEAAFLLLPLLLVWLFGGTKQTSTHPIKLTLIRDATFLCEFSVYVQYIDRASKYTVYSIYV